MRVIEAGLPGTSQPQIAEAAVRTDVGAVRKRNEDAAYLDPERRFFIVADGMGGHSSGDVASAMAVATVRELLEAARADLDALMSAPSEAGRERVRAVLERSIRAANVDVLTRSQREPDKYGMGTTVDVVLMLAGEAFVAHVGDTRTYLFRDSVGFQATVDHTVAQAMFDAGALTAQQAEQSPLRSVLSNAVGSSPEVIVDHVHIELEPGDRLLVCSDGLYDYFAKSELTRWVSRHSPDRALAALIDQACARGGHDNITGIIVEIGEPAGGPAEQLPTIPLAMPGDSSMPGPLDEIGDDALAAFVEHALRESSQPHMLPAAPGE